MSKKAEDFMKKVIEKNPYETEFHQSVEEVVCSLMSFLDKNP